MKTYAYVRVSTKEQNIDRQIDALETFSIDQVFEDKQSGKDFDRPAYLGLISIIKPGDLIIVKSIDRLGRNYDEILEQWRIITKEKHADILVLDMPLLDTRKKEKDITGTFVADLVLQILAYVAQTERDFNKKRQKEGIESARARGVHFGRPQKEKPQGFEEAERQWRRGNLSAREAGRMLNVTHVTFLRWVRKMNG